ncbi:MAG: hypothetical protein Q4G49_15220 [Paracoccus sp. (in: a-proteobacteria)]|nr:hypothetical protein [Paracoccus sp. (in: a-proteobacteria)]
MALHSVKRMAELGGARVAEAKAPEPLGFELKRIVSVFADFMSALYAGAGKEGKC